MKMILHDMNDGECRTMLAQCSSFENLQDVAHLTQLERSYQREYVLQQESAFPQQRKESHVATTTPKRIAHKEVKAAPQVAETLRREGEMQGQSLPQQKENAGQDKWIPKKKGTSMYSHSNQGNQSLLRERR
jgi:hypothetical protein